MCCDGVAQCKLPHNGHRISHDAMEQRHVVDGRLVIFAFFRVIFAQSCTAPDPDKLTPPDTSKAPRTGHFLMGRIALLSRKMRKRLVLRRLCGPTRTTPQSVAECHKVYYIFNNINDAGLFQLPWHSPTLPATLFLSRIRRARFSLKIPKSPEIFRRFFEKFLLRFVSD